MSSPVVKESIASEMSMDGAVSFVSEENRIGDSYASDLLSSRFDSLRLVCSSGNAAFFVGRELGASADEGLVAVKVFTGPAGRLLELFQLEAHSAAKLSHQNILQANSLEEVAGVHFAIMEHRPQAISLRDLLDRQGWLDPRSAIAIAHQIVEALDYAHGLGVLHLGIRPETILVDPDGTARLTDFGLEDSREVAWAQIERCSKCPVQYASPEQARGGPVDSRSDLYSLGVVLYQMLTDRLPVESQDPDSARHKSVARSPLAAHLYCPSIPEAVSLLATRLLEQDPESRFQDAASVLTALDSSVSELSAIVEEMRDESPLLTEDAASNDSTQHVEESRDGDERSPLDTGALPTAVARHVWEEPTITVVNQPDDSISLCESESDSGRNSEETARPTESSSPEESANATTLANGPHPPPESKRRSVILPLILGVILASAAIGGVIVLARADRAKTQSPVPVVSPSRESDDDSATPSSDRPEGGVPNNNQLPAELRPLQNAGSVTTPPETAVRGAGAATGPKRVTARRPPTTRRLRPARRKLLRPARYWRNYPYKRAR